VTEHLLHERHPRPLVALQNILVNFSPAERLLMYVLASVASISTLLLVISLSTAISTLVPSRGGSLSEGAVGTPRFINPLLAVSQTDQDLTMLVYSGLIRITQNSEISPDLAERYEISEDGTQYTFHIRENAVFHDARAVTAHDVAFTVALAQDPNIKSPRRADWEGVTTHVIDDHTIVFTLPHAYAPFLENTQLGILPKHLWENIPADEFPFHVLNTKPIGSGPYAIGPIATNDAGTPLSYELLAFKKFTLGEPFLSTLIFHFFSNEESLLGAFKKGDIDSFAGVSPDIIPLSERTDVTLVRAPSTRVFGVFLNQNHAPILADAAVREALSSGVNRKDIISSVLSGYGTPAYGPIPQGLLVSQDPSATSTTSSAQETARDLLVNDGWKFVEPTSTSTPDTKSLWKKKDKALSFALATADVPELVETANKVAEEWRAAGIDVSVQVYPLSEFNTTVLRPREYDAILFGQVIGRSLDLFAFWHSSQRNDPGLNLALYANSKTDKVLASARAELNKATREGLYHSFSETVAEDKPAIFLYSPDFVYIVPATVQNLSLGALTSPSERFLNVYDWYTDTERVWDVFAQ
jgi:peptide/nickel transport system substrate-binding protein